MHTQVQCPFPVAFMHTSSLDTKVQTYLLVAGTQIDARTAKIKWKKLARRAITAAGGKIKVKKLQKQLLHKIETSPHQHAVAVEQLMLQLASSKQFAVAGSSVSLNVPTPCS